MPAGSDHVDMFSGHKGHPGQIEQMDRVRANMKGTDIGIVDGESDDDSISIKIDDVTSNPNYTATIRLRLESKEISLHVC